MAKESTVMHCSPAPTPQWEQLFAGGVKAEMGFELGVISTEGR